MNNSQNPKYMKRNLLYAINLLTRKNKESVDDYEATRLQVIQVVINNFAFLGFDDIMYIHTVNNRSYGIDRFDNIIIIELFLPNVVRKWREKGVKSLSYLERLLLVYMLYEIKDCRKIGGNDKFMNEFINDAVDASNDDYMLAAYDKEEETMDAIREQAMDEGIERGKSEGIEQNKIETAKTLYNSNVSMEIIKKATGFTAKQIRNICL